MIGVQYHLESQDTEANSPKTEAIQSISSAMDGHGFNEKGEIACCRRNSNHGLVDCSLCLDEARKLFLDTLNPSLRDTAREILTAIDQSKEQGIKKSSVIVRSLRILISSFSNRCSHQNSLASSTTDLLHKLLVADIPQAYWVGYEALVLVSAHFITKWGVAISQKPLVYIFPRRWMDAKGRKVSEFWQAAIRAVMGTVIFRPGISQVWT